jgi:hypothetical protein
MAARRRQGRRFALALAVSLAVHAGLFLTVMNARAPPRREPGTSLTRPVEIAIERLSSPAPKASTAHLAAPVQAGRRMTEAVEPSPVNPPPRGALLGGEAGSSSPSGQTAQAGAGDQARAAPGPALKFDCPPPAGLSRPGAVRADPCAFKNARRDHLPEEVARQARIESDKAAYYDRVLEARRAIIDDPSRGNTPMVGCALIFGGGQPAKIKKPLHSLKLGPLPCFVIPPEGPLDPEVFVEPPPPKHPLKPGEMKE